MDSLQPKKTKFRTKVVSENTDVLRGNLFCEFGVHNGSSIIDFHSIYKRHNLPTDFFGFDSFEGLPEEKVDGNSPWKTGQFSCQGTIHPQIANNPDITTVKGWYCDTLNKELIPKFNGKKIGLVHIDCDIYSSTVEVLEFLITNDLLVDGALVIYDDWGAYLHSTGGVDEYGVAEGMAHKEIVDKYDLSFDMIYKEVIDPKFYIMSTFKYNK